MKKVKLLCFPYAGGSASIYNRWKTYLDSNIELVPIELAGRGRRIKEDFYKNMDDAIDDVYSIIKPMISDSEYAIYGHSMGTVISFELCHRIIEDKQRQPIHLFMSGRYPPHLSKDKEYLSRLPDNEFKDEIIKIGGTSEEVFQNKELFDIFIPILKADYRLIEEYEYIKKDRKFNCGITVLNGKYDIKMFYSELLEWRRHTAASCSIFEFDGGHFFIHNYFKEIAAIINSTLAEGITVKELL